MARINNQYHSPYEATIARYLPFIDSWLYPAEAAMRTSNEYWWKEQRHFSTRNIDLEKDAAQKESFFTIARDLLWKYNRPWLKNIAGGFTPVAYMWKDFKDTFKPYKADYQRNRDWLQPINGIGNILRGVLSLPLAVISTVESVLMLVWQTLKSIAYSLYDPKRHAQHFFPKLYLGITWTVSKLTAHVLDSAFSIIRGVTQIATFPLTWLVKIPLRQFGLTPKDETGECIQQNIEDNVGVKKMAQLLQALKNETAPTEFCNTDQPYALETAENMLKFKVLKSLQKGQPTEKFTDIVNQPIDDGRYHYNSETNTSAEADFYGYVAERMELTKS